MSVFSELISGDVSVQRLTSLLAVPTDVETCPNFVAPLHTTTLCRGVSEVNANGDCNNQVLWSKGSMCQAQCEEGYGFFDPPAKKYDCGAGGQWSPEGSAPECYRECKLWEGLGIEPAAWN